MFHIQPSPVSFWIWIGIFVVIAIVTVCAMAIAYSLLKWEGKGLISTIVIGILVFVGLASSSAYYNYTHSATYNKKAKEISLEYNPKQIRNLKVYNFNKELIYEHEGNFNFDRSGKGVNLVDNVTGKKISIFIGDNDTVIVEDK